jgi:hypothetical protein
MVTSRQIIELKAGGPDDPGRRRTAAVLSAYFHAEQMRTCRRLLWRRLAMVGLVWLLAAALTAVISRIAFVGGLAVLVTIGSGAAVAEWRASEELSELLRGPAKPLTVIRSLRPSARRDMDNPGPP